MTDGLRSEQEVRRCRDRALRDGVSRVVAGPCKPLSAPGAAVYVGSKHAVEGMTKSAALEVAGTGVRVNVVAPGTTDTGMLTRFTNTDANKAALVSTVPVKRLATPEEIAHVIVFVGSADASYMTGASIPVDGGMLAD
jgi:NAD(P)-dependent dehydrogenase (short-subunit alcohol dehydrogenase family)